MVAGYCQVYDDCGFVVVCVQRHGKHIGICFCDWGRTAHVDRGFGFGSGEVKERNNMGAIIVSIFVSVVAVGGLLYFNRQERKQQKRKDDMRLREI